MAYRLLPVLILTGFGILFGCKPKAPESGGGDKQPIRIGMIVPLSGDLAPYGKNTLDGAQLAVDQINAKGGVNGRNIELKVEDNQGTSTGSVNAYNKLVGNEQVIAVIAPVTSTNSLAIKNQVQKLQVPAISPTATNDRVTLRNDNMFRACFNDEFQGQAIARHAHSLGAKTAAVMVDNNSDYSKGLSNHFSKAFVTAGGKIVAQEGYQQKDTDFSAQMKQIKNADPDILFIPGYPPELQMIIKAAKAGGLRAALCGSDGWDFQQVITGSGSGIQGAWFVGAFAGDSDRPIVRQFVKSFNDKYNREPGSFEALGFDTVQLLAKAIGKQGASPEGVRKGLVGIKDIDAVTGVISMTLQGDAKKGAVILEIVGKDGAYTKQYKTTVKP